MTQPAENFPIDEDALLLAHVRNRDVACPLCEYNLRALTSTRCPECGHRLQLRVALVDPYMRDWIATLIPLCGSGGIGIVFAIALVIFGPPRGSDAVLAIMSMVWFIGSIPLAVVVMLLRRGFMSMPRTGQRWLAIIAWGAAALAMTLYFVSGW